MTFESTEAQRRVLLELAEAPDPSTGDLSYEQLAEHLGMSVDEVRGHVQALIDVGFTDERLVHRGD